MFCLMLLRCSPVLHSNVLAVWDFHINIVAYHSIYISVFTEKYLYSTKDIFPQYFQI